MDEGARDVRLKAIGKTYSVQVAATKEPIAWARDGDAIRIPVDRALWAEGIPVFEVFTDRGECKSLPLGCQL